jgi:hypothetical protein
MHEDYVPIVLSSRMLNGLLRMLEIIHVVECRYSSNLLLVVLTDYCSSDRIDHEIVPLFFHRIQHIGIERRNDSVLRRMFSLERIS